MSHEDMPGEFSDRNYAEEFDPVGYWKEKAEKYLEEGKKLSKDATESLRLDHSSRELKYIRSQNLLLGSIAASLIALAKK